MKKLEGKVAIITGCSGGLGKDIAIRFAQEGAKIAICARRVSKLEAVAKKCEEYGAEVLFKGVDLTDYAQIEAFVKDTVDRFGTVDILINNAVSITSPHTFLDHTFDELEMTFKSGYCATWHLMKLCFPYLKGKDSAIVNFGSSAGDLGMEGYAAYASTKEAIRGLSRVAAREWGQYGIRVNIVSPSAMTEDVKNSLKSLDEASRAYVEDGFNANPMKRIGTSSEDVIPVVLFLACEDSKWITGQTIYAEGGYNMHA